MEVKTRSTPRLIKGKRAVLYATHTKVDGEYVPSYVFEGEPYHYPTDWQWGTDRARFEHLVQDYNARLGYTPAEADAIVASSIAASSKGDLQ